MATSKLVITKKDLRKKIRQQRRQLSQSQLSTANQQLIRTLTQKHLLLRGRHIALYIGNDGEICPSALINKLISYRRRVFLPVLHPLTTERMIFCEVKKGQPLVTNRFGIMEPDIRQTRAIPARLLATVFMPLVAFDLSGNRIGMGGGFYDRTFCYKHRSPKALPNLIGLAHEFQKVDALPVEKWDVPMVAVVTNKRVYTSKRKTKGI